MKKEILVNLIKECIQEVLNENNLASETFSYNPSTLVKELEEATKCNCGSGLDSDWKLDARGIPLAKVCPKCEKDKLKGFRRDVLLDPNYKTSEPIDPDDMEESCGADCKCQSCNNNVEERKNKWIQKAVDPEHKGYCTPMTKPTCTPARKALAKRFKKGI